MASPAFTPDGLNFGTLNPGHTTHQTSLSKALTVQAQATAKITGGAANTFHLLALQSVRQVVVLEPPPGDGPIPKGPPKPIRTTQLEVTGQTDGKTPLSVPAGQMVQVDVEFDGSVGVGQSTAAPFSASLVIDGGVWTATLPLVGIIGEVTLSISNPTNFVSTDINIIQNHTATFLVNIDQTAGPPTTVSLLPFTGARDTGLTVTVNSVNSTSVQVQQGHPATASLTISAAQTAPIATTQYWMGVDAFEGVGSDATFSFGFSIIVEQLQIRPSPIQAKYASLGGASGLLGSAVAPEAFCGDLVGQFQPFRNGAIYWSGVSGSPAFEAHDPILTKWRQFNPNDLSELEELANLPSSRGLGYPVSDVTTVGGGLKSAFQTGGIYWSQDTGPHVVSSPIYEVYEAGIVGGPSGGPTGTLGFPTADSVLRSDANNKAYVFGDFENGGLFGLPGGPIGNLSARLAQQLTPSSNVLDQAARAIQTAVVNYNETKKNTPNYHRVGVQGGPFFLDPMLTGYTYDDTKGITQNRQYRIEQNLFSDVTPFWSDVKITLAFNVLIGKVMKSLDPTATPSWSVATEVNSIEVNINTRGNPGIPQSEVDQSKATILSLASETSIPPTPIPDVTPLTAKVLTTGAAVGFAPNDEAFPGEGSVAVLIIPPFF